MKFKSISTLLLLAATTKAFSQHWISEDNFAKQKCPIDTMKGVLVWHDASKWNTGDMAKSDSGYWVGRYCRTKYVISVEGRFMYIPGTAHSTGKTQSLYDGKYSKNPSNWEYDNGRGGSFYTNKKKKIPSSAVYALISNFPMYDSYYPTIDTPRVISLDTVITLKPF